jgi:hypothetical protein
MCTIGAARFPDGSYALFKNKDFGRPHFDDRVTLEPEVFGVAGVATWAGTDPAADEFSGFSFGANTHGLLCCDANVRTIPGHTNYDDLVEIALRKGTDLPTAIQAVNDAVRRTPYHWANLVMIDGEHAAIVEIRGDRTHALTEGLPIVRTNHHVTLGATPQDDNTTTSLPRLASAGNRVAAIESSDGIFDLLRSHDEGNAAICSHGAHQTVYCYILRRAAEQTTLSVVQGTPCAGVQPEPMLVPIGSDWSRAGVDRFRSGYPSEQVPDPIGS